MGVNNRLKMELKKIRINRLQFFLVGIVFIFMLSTIVSAFSVGFESTELRLYPGEVYDSAFSLQNYGTDASDITVEATVEKGGEYITFPEGTKFNVLANNNAAAPVKISIPENAKIGDSYPVKILFNVVSGNVGGSEAEVEGTTVSFAFSYRREITLKVVPKPAEPVAPVVEESRTGASAVWLWIVVIVVIILIIWWIIMASKKRKASEGMQRGK